MNDLERRLINDTFRTYSASTPGATFKCLLFRKGVYTAVGSGGVAISSATRGEGGTYWVAKTGATILKNQKQHKKGATEPLPNGDPLWGITYCNGKYMIMGDQGTLFYGAELKNITDFIRIRHPYPKNKIRGIAYGAGVYVIIGDNGMIMTSSDLLTWDERDSTTERDLYDIIFERDRFVVVGQSGTILVSFSGTSWSKVGSPLGVDLFGVLYKYFPPYTTSKGVKVPERHLFAALPYSYHMLTSPDAFGWTINSNGGYDGLYDLIHSAGLCIPVGYPGFITTSSL